MTTSKIATSTRAYVDAIKATTMPESTWFWPGGVDLFAGAQDYALDRTTQSNVYGRPHTDGSFYSSTAALRASFSIFNFTCYLDSTYI
jgi:hypothetical protein